jgi:hypothetical protein
MTKRTDIDWSKHEIIVESHPEARQLVHYLKRPNTICQSVKFINTHGILAVTGDFGNWIFCRSFVPSADGDFVSDGYWEEKLQIASTQKIYQFDPDQTAKDLNAAIDSLEEDFEDESDREEAREYYESCLDNIEDEHEYLSAARELPSGWDFESVIHREKPVIWLLCVFDAYDEIVSRLKEEKANQSSPVTT